MNEAEVNKTVGKSLQLAGKSLAIFVLDFFFMLTLFKVFIEFFTVLLLFYVFWFFGLGAYGILAP